jgi:hypothetical protein
MDKHSLILFIDYSFPFRIVCKWRKSRKRKIEKGEKEKQEERKKTEINKYT